MASTESRISVALVMKTTMVDKCMLPEIEEAFARIGIEISSIGSVTVSGDMPIDRFTQVFGVQPTAHVGQPPSARDMGMSGGFYWEGELTIPAALEKFVKHISVVPPVIRMQA